MAVRLAALVAAGLAAGAAAAALPAPVTLDGVGGVTPGMTPRQVSARWGMPLRFQGGAGGPGSTCRTARFHVGALRGYALFEGGRFGAVFFDRGARTPSGITIGSSEGALRRTYGSRLQVRPHQYVRGGHYFFLRRRQRPRWRIRFDTDGAGRVTQIAFGARAVAYVEGCA
jgi:hypothetical protein